MKKNIILIAIVLLLTGCFNNKNISEKTNTITTTAKATTTTKITTTTIAHETTATTTTTIPTTLTTTKKTTTKPKSTTTKPKSTTKKTTTTSKTTTTTKTILTTKNKEVSTTTTSKATTTTVKSTLTTTDVYNAMIALKSKYPTGTPWDNSNYYAWKGGYYSGGYGCAGFAFMLSDAAFGNRKATKHTNFDNIKVGDILRINNDTHSVIVLSISGDTYTIAEGNMNSAVYWGRKLTLEQIKSSGTYVLTRW